MICLEWQVNELLMTPQALKIATTGTQRSFEGLKADGGRGIN